jgi:DNA-binding transcriptional LysR family regulator
VGYFFPRSGRMRPLAFHRDGKTIEISPGSRVAVNDSSAYFSAVRAGLGVGQLLSFMVSCNDAIDELVSVLKEWQPPAMPVHVLYPANRHLSTKVRVFVDWAAELFSQSPCTRLLTSAA